MKLSGLYFVVLTLLSYFTFAYANPAPTPTYEVLAKKEPQSTTANTWSFHLYHNRKCSGSAKSLTGTGSTDCRTDVNDKAQGLIRDFIDPRCDVTIYKDKKCSKDDIVQTISYYTTDKCNPWRKKRHIKSFKVTCT